MRIFTGIGIVGICVATGLAAGTVETSVRPEPRPENLAVQSDIVVPGTDQLAAATVRRLVRPALRPIGLISEVAPNPVTAKAQSFQDWITAFKIRATQQGISTQVLDQAMRGLRYDADIIRRDRNQSEFTKTIWDYLDTAVSDTRVRNGKAALKAQQRVLDAIERAYGVDKHVVAAIWGLESAYGTFRGKTRVIEALATLAYDARRSDFFEGHLIAALTILQSGDTTEDRMTGSWAGAMGHTQFMPTSYLEHAVDFTDDGRRDIWSDDPGDALASTAAYLKAYGWTTGQPWGIEVTLPHGFDYLLANRSITKPPRAWANLGVVGVDGLAVANHGAGSILLPGGSKGAAFMIFDNFAVLEHYNTADAYVIGVGHLADRIGGGQGIQGSWPRQDRVMSYDERIELQQRLTRAGFDTQKIDAKIGPLTIAAVRAYQVVKGLVPDGYASLTLLKGLR